MYKEPFKKYCGNYCEIENGYCIYEEAELIEKIEFDSYIENCYHGENFNEKLSHFNYELIESYENLGSILCMMIQKIHI